MLAVMRAMDERAKRRASANAVAAAPPASATDWLQAVVTQTDGVLPGENIKQYLVRNDNFLWLGGLSKSITIPDQKTSIVTAFESPERLLYSAQGLIPVRVCTDKTLKAIGEFGNMETIALGLQVNAFISEHSTPSLPYYYAQKQSQYQLISRYLLEGAVHISLQRVERMSRMLHAHNPPEWKQKTVDTVLLDECVLIGDIEKADHYMRKYLDYGSGQESVLRVKLWIKKALAHGHYEVAEWLNTHEALERINWATLETLMELLNACIFDETGNTLKWLMRQSTVHWTAEMVQKSFERAFTVSKAVTQLLEFLIKSVTDQAEFDTRPVIDVHVVLDENNMQCANRLLELKSTVQFTVGAFGRSMLLNGYFEKLRWVAENCSPETIGTILFAPKMTRSYWSAKVITTANMQFLLEHGVQKDDICLWLYEATCSSPTQEARENRRTVIKFLSTL